jgi:hypothetical protein
MILTDDGLLLLDKSIDTIHSDLMKYAQLPDASEFFIQKQNNLLKNLRAAYNYFEQVRYFDSWIEIEKTMKELERRDSELYAHQITFYIKPAGNYFSRITFNPFAQ